LKIVPDINIKIMMSNLNGIPKTTAFTMTYTIL